MTEEFVSIRNLLKNMAIMGANKEELSRAIDYSIAVIDARKSYVNNGIDELVKRYRNEE